MIKFRIFVSEIKRRPHELWLKLYYVDICCLHNRPVGSLGPESGFFLCDCFPHDQKMSAVASNIISLQGSLQTGYNRVGGKICLSSWFSLFKREVLLRSFQQSLLEVLMSKISDMSK